MDRRSVQSHRAGVAAAYRKTTHELYNRRTTVNMLGNERRHFTLASRSALVSRTSARMLRSSRSLASREIRESVDSRPLIPCSCSLARFPGLVFHSLSLPCLTCTLFFSLSCASPLLCSRCCISRAADSLTLCPRFPPSMLATSTQESVAKLALSFPASA